MVTVIEPTADVQDRPNYDNGQWAIDDRWLQKMDRFATQVLRTTEPFRTTPLSSTRVLDIGCGYGGLALQLARHCGEVVGIDPCRSRIAMARRLQADAGQSNVQFRVGGTEGLDEPNAFDLITLDNVFEHLPNQAEALQRITQALAPGGVLFILTPNKLWPMEVHYRLPFLSYLPLSWANAYLRLTGRGTDYTDASYAPTYWGLSRLLRQQRELSFQYVLPADLALTARGQSWLYRTGFAAIKSFPWLWAISKSLLVVAVKNSTSREVRT